MVAILAGEGRFGVGAVEITTEISPATGDQHFVAALIYQPGTKTGGRGKTVKEGFEVVNIDQVPDGERTDRHAVIPDDV